MDPLEQEAQSNDEDAFQQSVPVEVSIKEETHVQEEPVNMHHHSAGIEQIFVKQESVEEDEKVFPQLLRKSEYAVASREVIIGLFKLGKTTREICEATGVYRSTARKWILRYQRSGAVATLHRSGRRRATTAEQDALLLHLYEENPGDTAAMIRDKAKINVTPTTVRNRLRELGMLLKTPASSERLTQKNIADRLHFCHEPLFHGVEYWKNVIFLDEKSFRSDRLGSVHCWRKNGARYSTTSVNLTNYNEETTVNMMGWIWSGGVGEIFSIKEPLTGEVYAQLLEEVVLPSVRTLIPASADIHLVHDNSPIHRSGAIDRCLRWHTDVHRLFWPPRSPDLNPMENVWERVVLDWDVANAARPKNLESHVMAVWESLRSSAGAEFCAGLVAGMPDRLRDTVLADGKYAKCY